MKTQSFKAGGGSTTRVIYFHVISGFSLLLLLLEIKPKACYSVKILNFVDFMRFI